MSVKCIAISLCILYSHLFAFVNCEKEPVENVKTEGSPSLRGHILDKEDVSTTVEQERLATNLGFIHAFVASFMVIIVSEIGDKTFFIASIMAMRHPRLTVFSGAMSALAFMTVLSVAFGWLATMIPRALTYYVSTALFAIFGLKMLKDGCAMSANEGQEEFEEVQQDLRKCEEEYDKEASASLIQDPESGVVRRITKKTLIVLFSRIFVQAFTLTFLAEWGDRSQLATIILAAKEDVVGVTFGGFVGHFLCTGLAVLGGRMVAQRISVKSVTILGGVVFLLFAVTALFFDPNEQ